MNRKANTSYDKYLASIHARNITPEEIIRSTVKEATGKDFASKKRIIAGEINEVYDITLTDDKHVILRISRSGHPNFKQEKWAIERCKQAGIPVPNILFIKYVTLGDQEISMCLMEKVEGEPLERGSINFNLLNREVRQSYIKQAGEILSKIHSIKTEGFGWIVGNGKGQFATSSGLISDLLSRREEFIAMAREENIKATDIDEALEIIKGFQKDYAKIAPCLNHGDYSHKHMMVKGNKITAIFDWGGVRSDTPIYDFANWDYWFGEDIPTAWLKGGYKNKALFDDNFDNFLHMLRVFKGLEILSWYHKEHYKQAVEKAKEKLLKDLRYFKSL